MYSLVFLLKGIFRKKKQKQRFTQNRSNIWHDLKWVKNPAHKEEIQLVRGLLLALRGRGCNNIWWSFLFWRFCQWLVFFLGRVKKKPESMTVGRPQAKSRSLHIQSLFVSVYVSVWQIEFCVHHFLATLAPETASAWLAGLHTNTEWRKELFRNIQQARQAGRVQFPIYPNINIYVCD